MTVYHGKNQKASFNGAVLTHSAGQSSWTLTTSVPTADLTSTDDTWEATEDGLADFTATVEGAAMQSQDYLSHLGDDGTLILWLASGGPYFSMQALCTGVAETADQNDVGRIRFEFAKGDATTGITYSAS